MFAYLTRLIDMPGTLYIRGTGRLIGVLDAYYMLLASNKGQIWDSIKHPLYYALKYRSHALYIAYIRNSNH